MMEPNKNNQSPTVDARLDQLEALIEKQGYLKEDLQRTGSLIGELGNESLKPDQVGRLENLVNKNEEHLSSLGMRD